MQYTPSVTPESNVHLLKRSLSLYFKAFPHVILLALITSLIAFTPRLIILIWQHSIFTSALNFNKLWIFVFNLAGLIFFTAILWRLQCRMVGNKDTLRNDIITACKKLPRIFVASLIQVFCVMLVNIITLALLMLFLPGGQFQELSLLARIIVLSIIFLQIIAALYVFFLFYFYLPLILTESKGILSSLKQSAVLAWKNIWRTISFQAIPWLTYLLVIILIREIFHIDLHIYFFTDENITFLSTGLQILLFALLIPWIAINMLVQLHDLELRKALRG